VTETHHMAVPPESSAARTQWFGNSRCALDSADLEQMILASEPRFRALSHARVLLIGATGWFGVWLLDALCTADEVFQLGIRITAVSRSPERFLTRFPAFSADSRIAWVSSDVRRLEVPQGNFTHVIHAANDSSVKSAPVSPLELFETIVDGTRCALRAAGTQCKSFLYLSSGAVYGPAQANAPAFVEDQLSGPDPASVTSVYAESKRAAEQLCAIAANRGLPAKIARCFAFVGPHMPFDKHFAIGNFIADAIEGRIICVRSDGRPVRTYLYMTDLICALVAILVDGAVARPYNVGSDFPVSIEDLAHVVNRIAGGRGVAIEGAASDPRDRYLPDITRLQSELGFRPQVSLEAAIARTVNWRRGNLAGSTQ
jgi:nucleoside-diphosphate-sugar epimerase